MPVESDKYVELALKYKNQITVASVIFVMIASFVGGRLSAVCPPKSKVCKGELILIDSLKKELIAKDEKYKKLLRKELDTAEKKCVKRIKDARKGNAAMNQIVDCEEAKAIMPQCKRRGRW